MKNGELRPKSAVSSGTGLIGLGGLLCWVAVARTYTLSGSGYAMASLLACGAPMLLWSLLIDKVHRNPTTGIDWSRPAPPLRETIDISLTKITGLWVTWALIAGLYCVGRWYWTGQYQFAMHAMAAAAPILILLSVPYILWIDGRLREPRDGAHAFGEMLLGTGAPNWPLIQEYARSWGVKGFFTAFMVSIVPGNFHDVIMPATADILHNPVTLSHWLIGLMFLIDVSFATVGYLLTMRPLDSHIRSANPYAAGWMAALICYPPFILMSAGGPLDYHPGTQDWTYWMNGHPVILTGTGLILVLLTAIYAWATVAFGIRFSNLTHRGIITHGPYRWTKHPAYLSKNLFWWLSQLPFLATTGNPVDMIRNSLILLTINGVYYWRALTEEKHLSSDPDYRAYASAMQRSAPLPRLARWLCGTEAPKPIPAE